MLTSKPFLRWAGSKKQHIPFLSRFWSTNHSRYIEPFAGSASLFFALNPKQARLSDINRELIRTYLAIQSDPRSVYTSLCTLEIGKDHYYKIRAQDPSKLNESDAAARFIYLNRFCFNGLYRTNKEGTFNVPYGSGKQGKLPSLEQMHELSTQFAHCKFACQDFEKSLAQCRLGDFVYIDPPYAVTNKRIFRQYNAASFGTEDLARLKMAVKKLDREGISFVVSYAYEKAFLELFAQWRVYRRITSRSIAGASHKRRNVYEAVVTNINSF